MRKLFLISLSIFCLNLLPQSGYIRGLFQDPDTEEWNFYSQDVETGETTMLTPLSDTLPAWGGGTVYAFNANTQQYFYVAESPVTNNRYLVTLDAYNSTVLNVVYTQGLFSIKANDMNGLIYGLRYIMQKTFMLIITLTFPYSISF